MSIWGRIKFACRVYRGLIPAIWRSWRAEPYPPPTYEEMLDFTKGVPTTPSCVKVLKSPGSAYREPPDYIANIPDKHWVRWK